ncbi:FGGY-family carbohydrate kinase [Rhizobium mesoamericanum]|uniref:FGGY carbohydrate kinase domain-containing protein n=1 Tax=Rhizobium mesoamericanum STM3625 TaxID=1211777 RepID=K0Q2M9_9HYPH|nr:FGGY-family carbohydrate kinase [Rhizobium mesoamericanum]CCM78825.1 FGGY carbohydrate kinase domain-containing protein [Rhizobium mesoamericanum STM3625]
MARHFLGIDVGTGSARTGVFNESGDLLSSAKQPIAIWHGAGGVVEQSSEDIWWAVSGTVRQAVADAGIDPASIAGIGFDATCSLVALGRDGVPISVSRSGDANRNIIVWMDHRAIAEADEINAGGHAVLRYVGGRMSPEMETPKLLWLKRHLPEQYRAATHFFDLSDYLTWRATGSLARSVCTVTCKWTYLAHEGRWDADYFRAIGLEDLAADDFSRIGTDIVAPGAALGTGLSVQAAADLGLPVGTPVGAALIDAHAGGIGTLGAVEGGTERRADIGRRLAYIFGTSACSMATTEEPTFVDGVWGPYFSAMVPGLWLNEGGQSAAGAAIDYLVRMHPASGVIEERAKAEGLSLVGYLERAAARAGDGVAGLADGVIVVPEFLGNRAPFADPDARALIAGLTLDESEDSLVALYVAGLAGLGCGLRQLLDALADKAIDIDLIMASGGAANSPLVLQMIADSTATEVASVTSPEPVLLGAAILGAIAGGYYPDLSSAMAVMSRIAKVYRPSVALREKHDRRYAAFKLLQETGRRLREMI